MRNKSSARKDIVAVIIAVTALFVTVGGFASCDKTKADEEGVVEIKEKMFMTQVNDVYLNAENYLGKTIKLEGIFLKEQWEEDTYCYVLRYGPGCCGDDGGNVGFEVKWPEDVTTAYPATDSWVTAAGVLKAGEMDRPPYKYLYLDLTSIDVLSQRGTEIVWQ